MKEIIIITENGKIRGKLLKISWLKLKNDAIREKINYNFIKNKRNSWSINENKQLVKRLIRGGVLNKGE